MKMTKTLLIYLILIFAGIPPAFTQTGVIRPLNVGDKMPDFVFEKVLNYKKGFLKVSDFKDKLLILDFWFTGCTVCIQQFPRLVQLQDTFGGRLFILPVGFDIFKKGNIQEFIEKRKGTERAVNLPVAVQSPEETTLLNLFPLEGYPHEVWIDKGIIVGITDHTAVTTENISQLLAGENVPFSRYRLQRKINGCSPFLIAAVAGGRPVFGSLISGYIDTIKTNSPFDQQCDSTWTKLFEVNKSLYQMYKDAYRYDAINEAWNKRIILENTGDDYYKDVYQVAGSSNWSWDIFRKKNLFCYELIMPLNYSIEQACIYMIKDLDRYFNISSKIEKRTVKCLALVKASPTEKFKPADSSVASIFKESEDQLEATMQNVNIKILLTHLNSLVRDFNVVNETGYNYNIDIEIRLHSGYDLKEINTALCKYGLVLRQVDRQLEMLVLTKQR